MIPAIVLIAPPSVGTERLEEAPEVLERDGIVFSLRGGPRQPKPTDRIWDCIAVYAPDELTEEEFQDFTRPTGRGGPELSLHY